VSWTTAREVFVWNFIGSDPTVLMAPQIEPGDIALNELEQSWVWTGLSWSQIDRLQHDAVTLAADADTLLGLTGQQLTLDLQIANLVLVGPANGVPAAPTFRALVAADIPGGVDTTKIVDADADTSVDTEESPDEDIIRMRTVGVERLRIEANGDIQGAFVKMLDIGVVMVQATAPSTPAIGQAWLDTATSGTGTESLALVTKTGAYTATDSDTVILCDASGGAFTITLPTAVGRAGKVFYIKKTDSSANGVTVDGDGTETIDSATTQVIATQYNAIKIISDGSEWHIL
jgi:hypothetical protein